MNSENHRIVVTGLGAVSAQGLGVEALREGVFSGRCPIHRADADIVRDSAAQHVATVPPIDFAAHFSPSELRRNDRFALFSLLAAGEALKNAGLHNAERRHYPAERMGVCWGTALGGQADAESEHAKFISGGQRAISRSLAVRIFGGTAQGNISLRHGLRGIGTTHATGCAAGNTALGDALRYLREGKADAIVAGAGEAPIAPMTFAAFDNLKTMSRHCGDDPTMAYRPFDKARDGFVMGEGAGALLLERRDSAIARGATIYAEVCGYALLNEAYHITTPDPSGDMIRRLLSEVLADAKIDAEQIDYINAHGSGTQLNDRNEAVAIEQFFTEKFEKQSAGSEIKLPAVSSTKPLTGHALGAAAALEAVITVLSLHHQTLPPTVALEDPLTEAQLDFVAKKSRPAKLQYAINNSFAFGGIDSAVIFRRA